MELHLVRDQVLVGQELQLPHPTSLHQLEGDVLRVGAQPAEYFVQTMMSLRRTVLRIFFLLLFHIRRTLSYPELRWHVGGGEKKKNLC